MSARPVIAVSGPNRGGQAAWSFTSVAVRRAGGIPIRVRPCRRLREINVHGLILGGGADVLEPNSKLLEFDLAPASPVRAQRVSAMSRFVIGPLLLAVRKLLARKDISSDPARDALEYRLLNLALAAELPILGICRGAQLLNLAQGGTLHRDLRSFYVEAPNRQTVLPRKQIVISPNTRLHRALGVGECSVNSLHRHAIDRVAPDLTVTARESNGVVQAVEHQRHAFVLGVQWHPEYLPQQKEQHSLFETLVGCARRLERDGGCVSLRHVAP